MSRPLLAPTLAVVGAVALLTACAPTAPAPVDLDAAREWVQALQSAESDGPGLAGSATLLIGPAVEGEPDDVESGSVRLDFEAPAALKRGDAACYGGGTAEVAITVFTDGGTTSDSVGIEIACDGEMHAVPVGPDIAVAGVDAVMIEGLSDTTTYLYVALVQELVVSGD